MVSKTEISFQKKLPQAIELEEAVLGAMLVNTKASDEVFTIVRSASVFYKIEHQLIFAAISDLYVKSQGVDVLTVSEKLRAMKKLEEVGGDFVLIGLTQKVATSAHVEYHSRILVQKYLLRRVISMNNQINALAFDDSTDVFDLLERYQNEFDKIVDITKTGRRTMSFDVSLGELKKSIERLSANTDEVPLVGVTTGFKRTDIHTGGYKAGNLVIIAARPGMGKTSKVLKTVIENIKKSIPVGVISLEMSMEELTARMVAIDTNFHLKQLLKTGFEKTEYFATYDAHSNRMKGYPVIVDDSGANDLTEIVITAKSWKRTKNIKLLVIDYLQLMDDKSIKGSNRESVMSSISRRLKLLAKELEIPVIALSQLSRAVETRGGNKRPILADLRDSGAIEQDADIVEFIYRPGYYGIDISEDDYSTETNRRCVALGANAEINYAKFRSGSIGTALLQWIPDKTKFIDVEDSSEQLEYIDQDLPKISPKNAFIADKTVFDA
jgi:replicative DNA helicase